MSHNYPYRRPTSDIDLRPEAGHYSPADRRHSSSDHGFYRPPQESLSYPSSSSSRGSTSAQWAQDGALSILSSCGLEPSDLALLAELPEDVLTVESLPSVLKQIKGKRGTINSFRPSTLSPSSSSSSYRRPPVSSSGDWDRMRSQPIQYPLDHVAPGSLLSEQDRWRNPRPSNSVRSDPLSASSSSSRYNIDFHHRSGPSEHGKPHRNTGPVSSQDYPSFSSAGQGTRYRPTGLSESRSADYRSAPELYYPKPRGGHRESWTSSTRKISRNTAATLMPSEKEALDFHGTCPTVLPYSCSLCDITVLSEKVWIKHINGTQHAEGQLSLLQKFPEWDCRVESVSRAKKQVEKGKDEEKTTLPSQTSKSKPHTKTDKKIPEKSKVVCVKFPPQSVDEAYLRKLTEPFGKIIKILTFPSLAFVELGSADQAQDLVKFHVNYPPTVNGEQIEFSISNTFNFLRSSQVVSFTPVPSGEDGQSDLISIVKRFGPPLYSLFLPSMAYVEMNNTADAQKLVDYYSSNTLRINNYCIKVSFSGEFKTLMGVSSAQKYEEEKVSTKRMRSSSREKEDEKTEAKRSRSSNDQEQERRKSRSREKSSREKRTQTRSRSRDKLSRETTTETSSASTSRDKSKEKSNKDRKTRSRSRDKSRERSRDNSSSRSSRQDRSREKSVEGEKPEPESKEEQAPRGEALETRQPEENAELSADDSDIEGMEVIGEDGENVVTEDMEIQNNLEEEETAEENKHQAARTDSPEHDKEVEVEVKAENNEEEEVGCEVKKPETKESETNKETEEAAETQLQDDEEEPDFPVDLENCITLDELEDQSDNEDEDVTNEAESWSTRVVYFQDLPLSSYTDAEFIKLVQDFGTAVRYLLIKENQEGFIEMSSSSEAQKAAVELSNKSVTFNGSKLIVSVSHQYHSLSNGYEVQSDSDQENKTESQKSSKRQSESKTLDRVEESSKKSPEEESESESKMSAEKQSSNRKYEEKDTTDKESNACKKSPEEESSDRKTETIHRRTPEKELSTKNISEEELEAEKTEENNSATDESPEKELSHKENEKFKTTLENDSDLENKSDGEKIQTENEEKTSTEDTPETEECEYEPSENQRVCSEEEELSEPTSKSLDQPESTGNLPKPQQLQDSEDSVQMEEGPGPAGGPVEAEEPTKPVGTEFVRPVVGYFCNLCQLIYADEDEAKLQHCSSLMHYRKYQEKTGKDPWSS